MRRGLRAAAVRRRASYAEPGIAEQPTREREGKREGQLRRGRARAARAGHRAAAKLYARAASRVCHDSVERWSRRSRAWCCCSARLHGHVMRGPIAPVCRVGTPCEAPAKHATVYFTRLGRHREHRHGRARATTASGSRAAIYSVTTKRSVGRTRPRAAQGAHRRRQRQARRPPHRHRNSLADNEVHEPARDDDRLPDLLAVQVRAHLLGLRARARPARPRAALRRPRSGRAPCR